MASTPLRSDGRALSGDDGWVLLLRHKYSLGTPFVNYIRAQVRTMENLVALRRLIEQGENRREPKAKAETISTMKLRK